MGRERDALLGQADLRAWTGDSRHARRAAGRAALRRARGEGLAFRPPVYLSDQWGCPDGTPLIGVPFYLADARLERIEAEMRRRRRRRRGDALHAPRSGARGELCVRALRSTGWSAIFGDFSTPYREHYRADPFSRDYVRHILGWYAQKHPDEDFAETFAVWMTPGLDWRSEYRGWPALAKLE